MASHGLEERQPLMNTQGKVSNRCPECIKMRYVLAVLSFLGFLIFYALRVNLSVALVAMVNKTASESLYNNSNHGDDCPALQPPNTTSNSYGGTYAWDLGTQGLLLAAFSFGYLVLQIPGGLFADKFGGKWLLGISMLISSALTLVTPIAAETGVAWMLAVRAISGLAQGVTFPAMYSMWGCWAPPLERSKLGALTFTGASVGIVVTFPAAGYLCESNMFQGWPLVFYATGGMGIVWFLAWTLLVYDSPEKHPWISITEKNYIQKSFDEYQQNSTQNKITVPWRSIWTSKPVLALTITQACSAWGFFIFLTMLPTYMQEILKYDISQNGLWSALPYLSNFILSFISGYVADILRKYCLSTTSTRKLLTVIGTFVPALFLIGVIQVGCSRVLVISLLTASLGFLGVATGGFAVNHIDLAPNFAGIIMGIANMAATIPAIAGPYIAGMELDRGQTRTNWAVVFYITSGVLFLGSFTYTLFGSGEQQSWSYAPNSRKHSTAQSSRKYSTHCLSEGESDKKSVTSLESDSDITIEISLHNPILNTDLCRINS